MYQIPYRPRPPHSCDGCGFLDECGGLDGPEYAVGCFRRCAEHCQYHGCDLACPCLHLTFPDLLEEAGGLWAPPEKELISLGLDAMLPQYVPQICHGGRRNTVLDEPIVAVPLSALVGRARGGKYDVRYDSPEAARQRLKLAAATEIVVISVAPDQIIEDFWESHVTRSILPKLAKLRLRAMTVPNFSFMVDVPRINSLRNVSRMFRVADRMSSAGIPTLLHIQASTKRDWVRWADVLREQPRCETIVAEFQTGTSTKKIGDPYFHGLAELQQNIGRKLHLIAVAGGGRIQEMENEFPSSTVVDSTPFIKTVHRQVLVRIGPSRWKWRSVYTAEDESLSARLKHNVLAQKERVREIAEANATSAERRPAPLQPQQCKAKREIERLERFALRSLSSPSIRPPMPSVPEGFQ
jgi:Domain of unknown function (DUF4417)